VTEYPWVSFVSGSNRESAKTTLDVIRECIPVRSTNNGEKWREF
jgi:hypothetical protein